MNWRSLGAKKSGIFCNEIRNSAPTKSVKTPMGNPSGLIGGVPRLTLYGGAG